MYPRCQPLPAGYRGELPTLDPCPGDIRKATNYGILGARVVFVDYDMSGVRPPIAVRR